MTQARQGILFATGAYLLWGFFPIYWKALGSLTGQALETALQFMLGIWLFHEELGPGRLPGRLPGFLLAGAGWRFSPPRASGAHACGTSLPQAQVPADPNAAAANPVRAAGP